jgi:serine-type D-Ala-D-Ala carboxypeptidase (penicillin-binding protein 5/6)
MEKILALLFTAFMMLPTVHFVNAETMNQKPEIVSEAAILMDSQSGAILYDKNADDRMVPASLTKIATAIYALEKGNLEDKVIVPKEATEVEGTKVYLEEGEVVTLEHLIQGMLINSGNDAATAIAIHLDGNVDKFSANLNKFLADKVDVHQTHFTNPHGLFNEDHYTTAHDLALITNYAMQNSTFKQIFGTRELTWDGESWDTTLITHHLLLKGDYPYEGITGGKTGFVDEAKQTLATTAENERIKLTAIVLRTDFKEDIYNDTQLLFDYGFQNFKSDVINKSTVYQSVDKDYFTDKDLIITSPIGGYEVVVTSNGLLQIFNQTGELIQTLQLKEKKVEASDGHLIKVEGGESKEIKTNMLGQNTFFIIFILSLTTIIFVVRKWKGFSR